MRKLSILLAGCLLTLSFPSKPAFAALAGKLENLVGFTVVASKTIAGWYDREGNRGESFKGCAYGMTIVFTDNRVLHCAAYGYQYAYRPTTVILSNGTQFKMIVDDEIYDMQQ